MNLSLYEQETIINYNEEEATASIYTHNRALIRKLDKFAQERPGDCHRQKTSHEGKAVDFTVPKSWVKIRAAPRLGRSAPSLHGGKILLDKSAFDMVFCLRSVGKAPVGIWTVAAK